MNPIEDDFEDLPSPLFVFGDLPSPLSSSLDGVFSLTVSGNVQFLNSSHGSASDVMDLECMICNETPCSCLARKAVEALALRPRCVKCGAERECTCALRIERVALVNAHGGVFKLVPLSAPLYWVTITHKGDEYEGVPLRSFPESLAKVYLQTEGTPVKQFGDEIYKEVRELGGFANAHKVPNVSLVRLSHNKRAGMVLERKPLNVLGEERGLASAVRNVLLSSGVSQQERFASFDKLIHYFLDVGETVLPFFCEEVQHGKYNVGSPMESLTKYAIAAFCGVDCKRELGDIVQLAFGEIVGKGGQQQNATYNARANKCLQAGDYLLAVLFKQLSCSAATMPKARQGFILNFLEQPTRDGWNDPTPLLYEAMREVKEGPRVLVTAQPLMVETSSEESSEELRTMVDRGVLMPNQWDPEYLTIKRSVLEAITCQLGMDKLESILNKRGKTRKGDLAYLLERLDPNESLESGDVVFVVYGKDGELKCTKCKPTDGTKIFGRSVVAGSGELEPYMVATPYFTASESNAGTQVVYLGHVNVKIKQEHCSNIKPGMWLCASSDGYAVPEGSSVQWTARVGKAIGSPFQHGTKWLVPAFVFVGRGENDMAMADVNESVKKLTVRIGATETMVVELNEGQSWLQTAIDTLEKQQRLLAERLEVVTADVSSHGVRHDGHDMRFGQHETSIGDLQSNHEDLQNAHNALSQQVETLKEAEAEGGGGGGGPSLVFRGNTSINKPVVLGDQFQDIPHDADLSQLPAAQHLGGNMLCEGTTTVNASIVGGRMYSFAKK
jgi:prefoldin subunit 5